MPVYDLALRLIQEDSQAIKNEVAEARKEVEALAQELKGLDAGAEGSEARERQLEEKRRHLEVLEVQSEVNLPSVRFAVETGKGACEECEAVLRLRLTRTYLSRLDEAQPPQNP